MVKAKFYIYKSGTNMAQCLPKRNSRSIDGGK